MEYKIRAMVSNRHMHLTKETYELLFDKPYTKKDDLNQKGQFSCNEVVTIKNGNKEINNVRIVGPFRSYNQIEISKKDARYLEIDPPVRSSGNLEDTPFITLETNKGSIKTNGLIISNRHIHMNYEGALKYNVKDKDIVKVKIDGDKSGIIDAEVKVSSNGVLELHVDTDDANAFLLENNDEVTLIV